jgi:hypothetical protein
MYRIVLKWVVLIGVRTEGVGISLSITLHDTWFDCLWNNWLIPAQHKWLSIAKHKEANKQAKYFGIEEFWSPLMNTKTHLWKKSLRTQPQVLRTSRVVVGHGAPPNCYQSDQCSLIGHLLNCLNVCSPWVFVNVWFYPKGFKIQDALHDYKPNFCTA